jgi:hypothetical protein
MTDVQFNSEGDMPVPQPAPRPKGLYGLVIKMGLAKDEQGARVVLVIIAIAAVVLAIAYPIFFS